MSCVYWTDYFHWMKDSHWEAGKHAEKALRQQ